ncbi:type II toxin-antitoxin system VapC family toxin [Cryomorpha ignava]|uniref:Type II toxin-antitoxin system VapC family toxin n=1 Tax=Cryomorpha ignava TaxID=101383 RepID=A0A7K3WPH0_9FLAO|nr:type II toxin-antitoxin system VapC family toxin [Cryomorpha ignava]
MRILIDANIIIYSAHKDKESLRKWLQKQSLSISSINQLEVLGYHKITKEEIVLSKNFFSLCQIISITQTIIEEAIKFRQEKSMSLGDSIVAASAKENNLPIATANIKDFEHI